MFQFITTRRLRQILGTNSRLQLQHDADTQDLAALRIEADSAIGLTVGLAAHGHGSQCRSSYISELEARVRRLQGRLDEAMGYDPETSRRLDAGATALWRDTVRW